MKVAILHDRFPQMGGGEHFAVEAARVLDAPIHTMYVARDVETPGDVEIVPIRQRKYTGFPNRYLLEWKNAGMNPLETLNVSLDMTSADLSEYNVILESAPLSKSYVPDVGQTVIQYPHSPPRWLFDLYRDRVGSLDYPIVGGIVRFYADLHRSLDIARNNYVDQFVANSEVVRDRIRRFYDRDADVVYPPVTGDWRDEGDGGYFVTWSRLDPEKRIPMICEAFSGLDERLIVAGDGEQRKQIERFASRHGNIEYRGFVDDIESLVSRARAVVYAPTNEDFGLVGAEALTAGKPLIGVDEGFTAEQAVPGVTGVRFDPTVESLRSTIESFDPGGFDPATIQDFSERYDRETFERELLGVIERCTS